MTRTCDFPDVSPCDDGRVFCSGDSEADTFCYCRKHYSQVRKLRAAMRSPLED